MEKTTIEGNEDRDGRLSPSLPYPYLIAALLVALPSIYIYVRYFGGLPTDDAYIFFRFSENWATGKGLTWNPGEDPVEGFTGFAWVAVGALLHWITGVPLYLFMHYVALVCWFVLVVLVSPLIVRLAVDEAPGAPSSADAAVRFTGGATVMIVAANVMIGFHTMHAMETALHILIMSAAAWLALGRITGPRALALAAVTTLAFVSRPDSLAYVLPLYGLLIIFTRTTERRYVLASLAASVLATSLFEAVKWAYFGYPLPNTVYVKSGSELFAGLDYVREYSIRLVPLGVFLLFAWARCGLWALLRDRRFILLFVPALLFTLAYVKFQPVAGFGYRFLVPVFPMLLFACLRAYAISECAFQASHPSSTRGPLRFITGTSIVFLAVMSFFTFRINREINTLRRGMQKGNASGMAYVHIINGRNLEPASHLPNPPLMATGDVGAAPYFSRLPTLDLIGLCDEFIAHEGVTHEYLARRQPDLYMLQDLYLEQSPLPDDAQPGEGQVYLRIDGELRAVDMNGYKKRHVLDGTERSGRSSTYWVVTSPGFPELYEYVGDWVYSGGRDHYYAFLRKDYPHFDDVAEMLIRTEPGAEEAAAESAGEGAKFTSVGLRSDGGPLERTIGPEGRQSWRLATSRSGSVYYDRSQIISVTAGGSLETEVTVYFEEVENGYMNVGLYFLDREGKALGGAIIPSLHRPEAKWIIHSHSTRVPAGALTAYIQFQWKVEGAGPVSGVLYCESVRVRQAD